MGAALKNALSGCASATAESPQYYTTATAQWHVFDLPCWQIAWPISCVFTMSAWQLLNWRWAATMRWCWSLDFFFSGVLEVTSGPPRQCQWMLAGEIMPPDSPSHSLPLDLSSLWLFFVSADTCSGHMTEASFHPGPIKLRTPDKKDNKGNANLYKGYFIGLSAPLW